jgi:hypothetical protein
MAVDLAKLSLWLVTLARDHSFTFLDHALRHGDSLVGLNQAQLEAFHWDPSNAVPAPVRDKRGQQLAKVRDLRRSIREAADTADEATLSVWWSQAQQQLDYLRTAGDLVVSVYFEGGNPADQNRKLTELARDLRNDDWQRHRPRLRALRSAHPPLVPFHWDLEYPEVFDRTNPGFDAFVGNPPFAGKNTLADGNVPHYPEWLKSTHAESHGNADVVAHFFRRCFGLLRGGGNLGLIATNTIAQGDTRSSGLRWICSNGGAIYSASRRVRWPGLAAVIVSVVHIHKGQWSSTFVLDGKQVATITAFLFHAGGHNDPERLQSNAGKSFQGSIVLGMGFTFDDTDTKGVASSLDDMKRLLAANPRNREVIFPYIGGEEVNSDPRHAHHRHVINFGDRTEAECRAKWPELMDIVERNVKPEREKLRNTADGIRLKQYWWHFARTRPELYAAIEGLDRVLAISSVTPHASFAFLPTRMVYSHALILFPLSSHAAFAALQSRLHDHWARFFGSSLEDRLRYTPSDCFETFPFPEHWQDSPTLEAAGKAYYDYRAQLMVNTNLGLTKTYNRFHDPDEHDPAIQRLRELHAAMDRAVLEAYGWSDIPTDYEFIPDYIETDDEGNETPKSIRYRWPDAVRDEVLARLLDLNERRHKAEVAAGLHAKGGKRSKDMFDEDDDS